MIARARPRVAGPVPLLGPAMHYLRCGWSVVPATGKKPSGRWKPYQSARPDQATVRDWFADVDSDQRSIAIVCGQVSGGLLVRDFDKPGSYEAWRRQNRNLARQLPTVQTARGAHVYFRVEPGHASSRKLSDGELRGNGNIVIAPPSKHARTGLPYRWIVDPTIPPIVDLEEVGITKMSVGCNTGHVVLHRAPLPTILATSVDEAIVSTLPSGPGERNRRLFDFARQLRRLFPDGRAADHDPHLREWFSRALAVVTTKDFETTRREFSHAWEQLRANGIDGGLEKAWQAAQTAPLPPEAYQFQNPGVQMLVALCYQLQRQHRGGRPFYLGCREAARLLGIAGKSPHVTAHRWLWLLIHSGVLEKVSTGSQASGKANEYLYKSLSLGEVC